MRKRCHEKKSDGVRVDHEERVEKKSDGVRVYHERSCTIKKER